MLLACKGLGGALIPSGESCATHLHLLWVSDSYFRSSSLAEARHSPKRFRFARCCPCASAAIFLAARSSLARTALCHACAQRLFLFSSCSNFKGMYCNSCSSI